jgi:hypothetical protein
MRMTALKTLTAMAITLVNPGCSIYRARPPAAPCQTEIRSVAPDTALLRRKPPAHHTEAHRLHDAAMCRAANSEDKTCNGTERTDHRRRRRSLVEGDASVATGSVITLWKHLLLACGMLWRVGSGKRGKVRRPAIAQRKSATHQC